jgi:hypothetical protein
VAAPDSCCAARPCLNIHNVCNACGCAVAKSVCRHQRLTVPDLKPSACLYEGCCCFTHVCCLIEPFCSPAISHSPICRSSKGIIWAGMCAVIACRGRYDALLTHLWCIQLHAGLHYIIPSQGLFQAYAEAEQKASRPQNHIAKKRLLYPMLLR